VWAAQQVERDRALLGLGLPSVKHILPILKTDVGLLTGHTTLRADMFKLGITQQQDCQLNGDKKNSVCYCLALACKKIQNNGLYVPENQGSRKHEAE
jgi:hypothetical protein